MSRIERKQEEKNKKRARRAVYRLLFLCMMICILSISTFLIDKEATLMMGEINTYNIEVFVKNIGKSIFESYKDIEEKLSKLNNLR
ncbi:Uncharacterised protein [[Clostridium] sordellii]|uniref:Uncharacterized protein n=1 Tax=Paraclostridium sordellii TaxID=1505 RepID=A0ABM9RKV5_PARSO|nr:hypothetical protein [Paeniclostridium sordellii]CEJ72603.1 conserved hypothetical protein [[Clostridium] sordellii] [Paeniclostridium sordellii]CEN68156.1 Uncharacterised protein [[Clostridium] sordellii] [Paeniclostridium sordellii]CEN71423.1 Uncharacterised protein [[Clostridium] sordellii] [Paeniclostridium sordellii]CEO21320.1 Uncharacterised protein [[Clostridium] sordellii] [Paeniclostridium sordellii]CEP76984.1 Uncharacterised protein [[Clostridium] sordellii] [Paeniclostridium sord